MKETIIACICFLLLLFYKQLIQRIGFNLSFQKTAFMEFLKDYWTYIVQRKKWFLIPVILLLFLLGFIILAGGSGGTAVSQLIYAMF